MAETLAVLHSKQFVHDDIRITNFVLTNTGNVLLVDFQSGFSFSDPPKRLLLWRDCTYDSPERVANTARGPPSDAWSFGIAIWLFWEETRMVPNFLDIVAHGEKIPFTEATPPDIRAVISGLLVSDPNKRLTARDVVEMIQGTENS
jgi:serine/threonine protein kinase